MSDFIRGLEDVIEKAKQRLRVGEILSSQRRLDESDIETLTRILEERKAVVKLLQALELPKASFDWDYKQNFATAVTMVFGKLTEKLGDKPARWSTTES